MKLPFLSKQPDESELIEDERNFNREQKRMEQSLYDDQTYMQQQEAKVDLLRWQQDMDDELMSLVQELLGKKIIEGQIIEQVNDPLCNQKFITKVVIPQCKPFLNRGLINSNWSEKIILTRLKKVCNTITDNMSDGWEEYDIKFVNYDVILEMIKTTIIAGAYRSLNGWTKKIDSTMIKRIEATNETTGQPQKNKGLMGVFKSG